MRAKPIITYGLLGGVLAGAAMLPAPSFALGLGRLTVQSGLGQPLVAEIQLTAPQKDELETLTAKVADPSVYRQNNTPYLGALSRVRISLENLNGVPYLKVTSPQAINEPYLQLMVELNWASGRVVRDYTFLLDPPGATPTQAVEPATPIRGASLPPTTTTRGGRQSRDAASASQPPDQRAAERPAAAGAAGDVHTVRRGDTLGGIAKQYKPPEATLEQMMVAMYRANEPAFEGKNMNRLRAGQILSIPPAEQVTTTPTSEAAKVVRMQAGDWNSYRDRVAGAAPVGDTTATQQGASGRISTAVQDKGTPARAGRDQLQISREAGRGRGASRAEDAIARDRALQEANNRIADLERTIKDMQASLALRSQSMSNLQRQAETAKAPEPTKGAPPVTPVPGPTSTTTPRPLPGMPPTPPAPPPPPVASVAPSPPPAATTPPAVPPTPAPVPTTPPSGTAPPTVTATGPTPSPTPAPEPTPETKAAETTTTTTTPPPTPPKAPIAKAPTKAPTPPPSFIDDLLMNTPAWAIGVGALALLGGIAAIVAARRRRATKFEDSIIAGTDIKTNTVFGSTGGGVVNTGENSLATDFSREGLGSIDTDEVDPIAEAEVYLAYGRDAQAEEILKDALKKDPQRQEVYLKLLEIHAQHNKPSAFETVATELYSVSNGQGETWAKAMDLGRQLDPSNPLYAEQGEAAFAARSAAVEEAPKAAAAAAATAAKAAGETQVFSVPPDLKPEPAFTITTHEPSALDFRLDEDISLSPTSGRSAKTSGEILPGTARERASAQDAIVTAESGERASEFLAERVDTSKAPEPKFDIDFNFDEPTTPAPKPAPKTTPATELAFAGNGGTASQPARPAAALELDKLDLSFDPERSTFEDPTPSVLDGQWHDAATKLDLAKAYQEMGDLEGAKEILQEVLHEGDDQQKNEAKALLTKLG